ncbi:hypothetical protein PLEOSDRAFT_1015389, partial [Pleurotus ostreatus PC15]
LFSLMGATGSGKSQFINTATKTNCMGVGHTLRSHTSSIQTIRVPLPNDSRNRSVVFVDTPSFNNTAARDSDGDADGELSDERVLEMLAEWLGRSYQNSIKLSGIIYTHRITDNRMAGSPLRNLHLFEQLVGVDAIPNVVLATTMWAPNPSAAQQSLSENREAQLVQRYWKAMLDQGS